MPKPAPQPKPLNLKGTAKDDTLQGGALGDTIDGGRGNDTLIGAGGGDTLTGGTGADTFMYLSFSDSAAATGIDAIRDFNAAEGDKVDLTALGEATLQSSYNSSFSGLQAVFSYNSATNVTTLSYYQGSTTPVFQINFIGTVSYSPEAFLGISNAPPPAPTVSINDVTVNEADGTITFTVTRSGSAESLNTSSTVDFATGFDDGPNPATSDEDWTHVTGTVDFAAGETSKTITVSITNDGSFEYDETFRVNLTGGTNVEIVDAYGVGTIANDDPEPDATAPIISVTDVVTSGSSLSFNIVSDEAGTAVITYRKVGEVWTMTEPVAVVVGTTPITITGLSSETDYEFTVQVFDAAYNYSEKATGSGTTADVTAPINFAPTDIWHDLDTISFDINTNEAGTAYLFLNGSETPIEVAVVAGANDWFLDGLSAGTTYDISYYIRDAAGNQSDTFNFSIGTTALPPEFSISDVTITEGQADNEWGEIAFTVTRSGDLSGESTVYVTYSDITTTVGEDYPAQAAQGITFAPGESTATGYLTIWDDNVIEGTESLTLTLYNPINGTIADGSAVLTIVDNDAPTEGNDNLVGTDDAQTTDLLGGDDAFEGKGGNDIIYGGTGSDIIYGGDGNDELYGGEGGDYLDVGTGSDIADGGVGDDTIWYEGFWTAGEVKTFIGGAGSDRLDMNQLLHGMAIVQNGSVTELRTNGGSQFVGTIEGIEFIIGTDFADVFNFSTATTNVTLEGRDGADTLIGGSGHDSLRGGIGNDILLGNDGNDTITGLDGNDTIDGGLGADFILGGTGHDTITGGLGNDAIQGEFGDDTFLFLDTTSYQGNDNINGGSGFDTLNFSGITGNGFTITENSWSSVLSGLTISEGTFGDVEKIVGSGRNDTINMSSSFAAWILNGDAGDDTITGGSNSDIISGGLGNDTLNGGGGNDTIDGYAGNDTVSGGDGGDIFVLLGNKADYSFARSSTGQLIITTLNGFDEGTDTINSDVEFVQFKDQLVTFASLLPPLPVISINDPTVTEGNGTITFTVTRTGDLSGSSSVNVTIASGTAQMGTDVAWGAYPSIYPVTFNAGVATRTITFDVIDDTLSEGPETFTLTLSSPTDATISSTDNVGTGTILANDIPTEGDDNLVGTSGNDVINLLGGNDTYNGLAGDDTVTGGSGDDTVFYTLGLDSFDGGDGTDTVDFSLLNSGIDTQGTPIGNNIRLGTDGSNMISFANVEQVMGSNFNDNLIVNTLTTSVIMDGADGDDLLWGGLAGDTLYGGAGNDRFFEEGGNDTLFGEDGDDRLIGGAGNDVISGGEGIDTAVFRGFNTDYMVVNNGDGTVTITDNRTDSPDGSDTLSIDIEYLQFANGGPVALSSLVPDAFTPFI